MIRNFAKEGHCVVYMTSKKLIQQKLWRNIKIWAVVISGYFDYEKLLFQFTFKTVLNFSNTLLIRKINSLHKNPLPAFSSSSASLPLQTQDLVILVISGTEWHIGDSVLDPLSFVDFAVDWGCMAFLHCGWTPAGYVLSVTDPQKLCHIASHQSQTGQGNLPVACSGFIQHMLPRVHLVSEEPGRAREEGRRENSFPIH